MPDANYCDGGVVWEEEVVRLDFHRLRCKFKQMVELIRSLQVCLLTRKPSDAAFAAMCVPSFSPASLLGFFPVFGLCFPSFWLMLIDIALGNAVALEL